MNVFRITSPPLAVIFFFISFYSSSGAPKTSIMRNISSVETFPELSASAITKSPTSNIPSSSSFMRENARHKRVNSSKSRPSEVFASAALKTVSSYSLSTVVFKAVATSVRFASFLP